MEIFKCTESQPHWFVTDRKPIKCVNCGKKEVKPSMFGMPTPKFGKVENGILQAANLIIQDIGLGAVVTAMPHIGKIPQEIELH